MVGGGTATRALVCCHVLCVPIKKKENSRSETAANSIRTLKNMYKGNNIFLEEMLILQIRNLTNLRCQRPLELDGGGERGEYKNGPHNTILQH
jgi:hypothetical protein